MSYCEYSTQITWTDATLTNQQNDSSMDCWVTVGTFRSNTANLSTTLEGNIGRNMQRVLQSDQCNPTRLYLLKGTKLSPKTHRHHRIPFKITHNGQKGRPKRCTQPGFSFRSKEVYLAPDEAKSVVILEDNVFSDPESGLRAAARGGQ